MTTYAEATRRAETERGAENRGDPASRAPGSRLAALSEALNGSAAVQRQARMAEALNGSAAVQRQRETAEALNRSPRALALAALSEQLSRGGGQAADPRPAQLMRRPDGASEQRGALAPGAGVAQLWGWRDLVPSRDTAREYARRGIGGAIGGAVGGYLAGAGGLLGGAAIAAGGGAGLALGAPAAAMAAGLALGGYGGAVTASYLGGLAAPYLGGAASYLGGAVPYLAGTVGGTVGGVLGERAGTQVAAVLPGRTAATDEYAPAVTDIMYARLRARRENPRAVLTGPERAQVDRDISIGMPRAQAEALAYETHYMPQVAQTGQYGADISKNAELSAILRDNPFIRFVVSGRLNRTFKGREARRRPRGNLSYSSRNVMRDVPTAAKDARKLFNELVSVDMSRRPITVRKNPLPEVVSSMSHDGTLNVGHPATRGILLHELGHHLEFGLTPQQIGSLHNFLTARSRDDQLRRVGYGRLAGGQGAGRGYDVEGPAMSGGTVAELALGTALNLTGLESTVGAAIGATGLVSGSGVDDFFRGRSADPTSSYSSLLYDPRRVDTEFVSTTIHYFDDPASARELVDKDPLRACLFLSLARPGVYDDVRAQFDALPGVGRTLDQRIHRIT